MADEVLSFIIIERPGLANEAEAVSTHRNANWKEVEEQVLQFFPTLCANNLEVRYWDEEDFVTVATQEELEEAFQVAVENKMYRTLYVRVKDDLTCSCFHKLSPAKMIHGANPPLERKSDQRTSENIQPPELPEEEEPAYRRRTRVPKDIMKDVESSVIRKTASGSQLKYTNLQASDDNLQDNFADCDESESATGERMMIPGASSGANVIAIEMPEMEHHGTETAEPAEIAETGEISSKSSRDAETGFWVLPHEKSSRRAAEKTKRKNASLRTAEDRAYLHDQLVKLHEHKHCKEKSQEKVEDRKKKHRSNPLSEETFYHSMRKFESYLKKDIAKTVAKKVKHSIVKALSQRCDEIQAAKQPEPDTATRTGFIHEDIFCDHCDREIVGIRFMCGNCENYDLCEECENIQPAVHDFAHVFIKIRTPCQTAGTHDGVRTPLLKKVIYEEEDEEGEEDPKEDAKPEHDVNEDWGNLESRLLDLEQSTASIYQVTVGIPPPPQNPQLRPVLGRNEDTGVSEEKLTADELHEFCIVPDVSSSQQQLEVVYQEIADHVESGPDAVKHADAVEPPLEAFEQLTVDLFPPLVDINGAGVCEDTSEEEKSGGTDLFPSLPDDHAYAQEQFKRAEKGFVGILPQMQMIHCLSNNSLVVNIGSDSLEPDDIGTFGNISDESSSTDEEFTVIVPDCFDISKPLPVLQNQEVPSAPPDEITIQWESQDSVPGLESAKGPEQCDQPPENADGSNKEADDDINMDTDYDTDLSSLSSFSEDTVESCLPAAVSNVEGETNEEDGFVKVSAPQEENTVSREADAQQNGACAALDDAALVEADAASQEQAPETENLSNGATHVLTNEEQLSEWEEHGGAAAAAADSVDCSPQPAMMSNPLQMASNGLQHLFQTGKDIFRTLQGTDSYECKESTFEFKPSDYKLPESTWQPSNKEYVPPKSNFTVPQSEFQMPKSSYRGPQSQVPSVVGTGGEYAGPLQRIREMGFFNNECVLALLKKHGGDVQKTLDELIDETDNDWSQRRH